MVADPDIEKPLRHVVCATLGEVCDCRELVPVTLRNGARGEVDVLCTPTYAPLAGYPFVIEVKTWKVVTDASAKDWIMQAYGYVGARAAGVDHPIAAAFLWLVDVACKPGDETIIANMLHLADAMQVGRAYRDPPRGNAGGGVMLGFGMSGTIWSERRALDPLAEWPVDGWSNVRAVPLLRRPV